MSLHRDHDYSKRRNTREDPVDVNDDTQYSGGEEEFDTNKIDLDLVFFYVQHADTNHQHEHNGEAHDDLNWVWSKKSLRLRDII